MKIAIVGTAFHFNKAPFDDPSWEIWGCNVGTISRWSRWFDLHDDASIDTYPGHREFLAGQTKPVYTRQNYPIEAMKAKYGDWFFTSTISYMLAVAIEEKPEEIGLWGVDLAHGTEYATQKPGCRFFIQVARMAGIKVTAPPEAEVMVPGRLYCLEPGQSWLKMKVEARGAELRIRALQNEADNRRVLLEEAGLKGALMIQAPREQIEKRLAELVPIRQEIERNAIAIDGALQENAHILLNWSGD